MTAIIFESSEVPVAYIKSDKDDTVVIMRSVNFDSEPNADGSRPLCYTGYQMVNRFFYLVFDYDPIYAPNDIDPAWATEWTPDGDLRLYLPEHEGYVHSEVFITVYDIKNLQQSIESKASLAENATPAPVYAEYPAALPTREPDPFAY